MSLTLPSFERYEEGSQIRRPSKSISSNIVEGFALRKYKNDICIICIGPMRRVKRHLSI
ncbi:MAG: four helix bundle protein [Bacteroidota bacterium]